VTTTAFNVARRSMRRRPALAMGADTWASTDHDARLDLHAAIRGLPPRQQEAVAMHYLLDMPVSDTASAMGCDVGTVKTHLSRARATLSRALQHDEGADATRRPWHD
jgi:RNA polymerase sigma-70 factor (ECF subfamily)